MEPDVILIHGWGSTPARTWPADGLAGDLREYGLHVVAPPLPGHGPRASARPEDYADLDRQLLDVLPSLPHDRPFDAVGFSLGGKLLLKLVSSGALDPRRLVILGVGANLFSTEAGDAVAAALRHGPPEGAGPGFRDVVAEALASENDPAALGAVIRRPAAPLQAQDLAGIACEVLVVVGEDDDIAKDPHLLVNTLPSATVVRLPGLGHASTPHDPRVRRLVTKFLRRDG